MSSSSKRTRTGDLQSSDLGASPSGDTKSLMGNYENSQLFRGVFIATDYLDNSAEGMSPFDSSASALVNQPAQTELAEVDQVSYDLIFKDDYIIAKIGDRNALIDTGCLLRGVTGNPSAYSGKR